MNSYWSTITKSIRPYTPGEQPRDRKYVKLNTNENPYPPSPRVIEAITAASNESLRLYPDPDCTDLRETIALYYGLKKEEVFAGNGSDELLAFAFLAFFEAGRPILFPDITYSFFRVYARLFRIDYELVPLEEDFSVPLEPFLRKNGGIIITNPNAPTGKFLPVPSLRRIIEGNRDVVVIVDEAYVDFGGESVTPLVREFPNLLVVQTLSKSRCLAGLRVGFAMGQEGLIEAVGRIKNSFNSYTLDRLALAAAVEAMKDEAYFKEMKAKIIGTRERVSRSLVKMGFNVIPSAANFIFISHPRCYAGTLFAQLKERGILVRYFDLPRIDNYLRVTIGSDADMNTFLANLGELICE